MRRLTALSVLFALLPACEEESPTADLFTKAPPALRLDAAIGAAIGGDGPFTAEELQEIVNGRCLECHAPGEGFVTEQVDRMADQDPGPGEGVSV